MTTLRSPSCVPVGLVPAAGRARRLALASGSKELVDVPDIERDGRARVPVSDYLLRQYRAAGIVDIVVARRAEKTDLAAHFRTAPYADLAVHDLVVAPTPGSAHTLALGAAEVPTRTVAAGFPDIVLTPSTLARDALSRLDASGADVCLAHVPIPAHERDVWDMSTFAEEGGDNARVVGLTVKPGHLVYGVAWALAVWRPSFTRFLGDWIRAHDAAPWVTGEVSLTHALTGAIDAGLHVTSVTEPAGFALDVGQPERLAAARALRGSREDR